MKKIMNSPSDFVKETIEGILLAYPDKLKISEENNRVKILEDMPLNRNDEVSLMINGLGATPLEEQFIIYRKAAQMLKEIGVHVLMPHIGEYATSMEMAGISITICRLDDELEGLLYDPADTPFYTNHNK